MTQHGNSGNATQGTGSNKAQGTTANEFNRSINVATAVGVATGLIFILIFLLFDTETGVEAVIGVVMVVFYGILNGIFKFAENNIDPRFHDDRKLRERRRIFERFSIIWVGFLILSLVAAMFVNTRNVQANAPQKTPEATAEVTPTVRPQSTIPSLATEATDDVPTPAPNTPFIATVQVELDGAQMIEGENVARAAYCSAEFTTPYGTDDEQIPIGDIETREEIARALYVGSDGDARWLYVELAQPRQLLQFDNDVTFEGACRFWVHEETYEFVQGGYSDLSTLDCRGDCNP